MDSIIAPALVGRCRLIKLRAQTKAAQEDDWNTINNYEPTDPNIIRHIKDFGSNYGLMVINNTVVIDCDTETLFNIIPESWKASLTTITGKGVHIFLDCPDSPPKKFRLFDENNIQLGDVRGSNSEFYTVGAGSLHPETHNRYKYKDIGSELVTVKWNDIKEILLDRYWRDNSKILKTEMPKIIPQMGNLSEQLGLRIDHFAMPNGKLYKRSNGEIQGSHPIHDSTTGMNFAINSHKNLFYCYRCGVGGDPISWIGYAYCNVPEYRCNDLSDNEFQKVVIWLKDHGYAEQINKMNLEYYYQMLTEGHEISEECVKDICRTSRQEPTSKTTEDIDKEEQLSEECISNICNTSRKETKEEPIVSDMDTHEQIEDSDKEQDEFVAKCYFDQDDMGEWSGTIHPILNEWESIGRTLSYSRPAYHFASLLALLSVGINQRACVKIGIDNLHCNVDVMVAGVTTISGKTFSNNMCVNTFSKLIIDSEYQQDILNNEIKTMMFNQTVSNPAFVQDMNYCNNALWYYNEAREFFIEADGYNKPIINNLCNAYDGMTISRNLSKRNKDDINISKCETPFVSLLYNMTVTQLKDSCTGILFTSGFIPRWLWFIETRGEMRKNITPTPEQQYRIESIKGKVYNISRSIFNFEYNSIIFYVNDKIEEWKMQMSRKYGTSEEHQTIIGRGFIHIYKIAMIFAMYDEDFILPILQMDKKPTEQEPLYVHLPDKWVDEAIRIYDSYLFRRMIRVLNMSKEEDKTNKVVYLEAKLKELKGTATQSQLLKATNYKSKDLEESLDALIKSGKVTTTIVQKKDDGGKLCKGPRTKIYCLVPEDMVNELGEMMDAAQQKKMDDAAQKEKDRRKKEIDYSKRVKEATPI